ncbi:NrfD/PsrC family molybdoenzyme membrane anchor subunit [Plantactinospora endophytica]|uniref:Polysulfide reductase n=1 Tax=Plantactinospora endophytica TaxID=673535 RepID=A0ABQ4DZ11_9ACTN|nr:NrfD/PsrC family molybdoenzyme membrane anchor subunit [Plantactinospora endophytica]GIG87688.1 polysulfide reductase [Plantactinospora endophytica]
MTGRPGGGESPGERFRAFRAVLDPPGGGAPVGRRDKRRPGLIDGHPVIVPPAEFASYYGRPVVKAPVWRHDIPAYLFAGGLAAGASLLAAGADLTGRPALRRATRLVSLGAVGASTYFLVNDLGRPARFHHMLRVFKPTSPLSVGTWTLAAFGPAAGLAAISEVAPALSRHGGPGLLRRLLPPAGRVAGLAAAATAPVLATYTGVLLADTAMPAWHDAYPDLPFLFAGSALVAGAGAGLVVAPTGQNAPATRLAVAGAVVETIAERRMSRLGLTGEPYRVGRPARLLRGARLLLAVGTAGALLGRRSRALAVLSGAALLASSVLTRFGVFEAGVASARDPKYTVLPQRERRAGARSAPAGDHERVPSTGPGVAGGGGSPA